MADNTAKKVMSLIATQSHKLKDLTIRDGQLIFMYDVGRIAVDLGGKRVFYNQIVELESEAERQTLVSPLSGYYFCIDSAVLWHYKDKWTQITDKPQEIVFIGVDFPQLGQENKIYINKKEGKISVWDKDIGEYIVVSDKTQEVSEEDIESLFD